MTRPMQACCIGEEAPAPQDGWRTGGLPALRAELDRIDNAMHDLLMQRAEVVEHVARSGKPAAFRPGREASIIRRLLRRHHGCPAAGRAGPHLAGVAGRHDVDAGRLFAGGLRPRSWGAC